MIRSGPISHGDILRYLKQQGFEGPYSGGKHQRMVKEDITLRLPNPHRGDIGRELLARLLMHARIDGDRWET